MPNTFDAAPTGGAHERSRAFLEVPDPAPHLEEIIEEAQLHRGSLREQDGYTVPFREGGSVRIRVIDDGDQGQATGLQFVVDAPTPERRAHIKEVITQQAEGKLGHPAVLTWEDDATA